MCSPPLFLGCGYWKEPSQWDDSFQHPSFFFFFSQIQIVVFIHVPVVHMLLSTFAMLNWWPYMLFWRVMTSHHLTLRQSECNLAGSDATYHNGHHGCYLAVKTVSNILKKAQGRNFEKEWIQFIDILMELQYERRQRSTLTFGTYL